MNSLEEALYDGEYYKLHYVEESPAAVAAWEEARGDKEALEPAIEIVKSYGTYKFNSPLTCRKILTDYKNVNKEIYDKLINIIYSNNEIARSNISTFDLMIFTPSFLAMTFSNPNLKLTEEQKEFAVNEAFEKYVTNYCNRSFGLKYLILRSSNWSEEEKKELVLKFYPTREKFYEALCDWKIGIADDSRNNKDGYTLEIDIDCLYEYPYEYFANFYNSTDVTDEIWKEIEFCKSIENIWTEVYTEEYAKKLELVNNKKSGKRTILSRKKTREI